MKWIFLILFFTIPHFAHAEKTPAHHEWYIGFGAAGLGNVRSDGIGIAFEGARAWDVDVATIRLFGDFAVRGAAYFGQLGLAVATFLTEGEVAPYLSADFGYGFSKADSGGIFRGQSASGFIVGAGLGLQFFRSSEINVETGFRWAVLLKDTDLGHPSLFLFRVGLFF